mmetsp:Transcript_1375/g.2863  ORF Transcript_1375/g.2863 Transcript_1375/m.2863 type:complete len:465 (-) Transcript_1375:151-1545(-)
MAIDEGDDGIPPAGDDWLIGSKEDLFDDTLIDEKETKQDGDGTDFEPEGSIPEVMPRCMDARTCEECMVATPSADGVQECTWFSEGFCEEGCGINGCGATFCPASATECKDCLGKDAATQYSWIPSVMSCVPLCGTATACYPGTQYDDKACKDIEKAEEDAAAAAGGGIADSAPVTTTAAPTNMAVQTAVTMPPTASPVTPAPTFPPVPPTIAPTNPLPPPQTFKSCETCLREANRKQYVWFPVVGGYGECRSSCTEIPNSPCFTGAVYTSDDCDEIWSNVLSGNVPTVAAGTDEGVTEGGVVVGTPVPAPDDGLGGTTPEPTTETTDEPTVEGFVPEGFVPPAICPDGDSSTAVTLPSGLECLLCAPTMGTCEASCSCPDMECEIRICQLNPPGCGAVVCPGESTYMPSPVPTMKPTTAIPTVQPSGRPTPDEGNFLDTSTADMVRGGVLSSMAVIAVSLFCL